MLLLQEAHLILHIWLKIIGLQRDYNKHSIYYQEKFLVSYPLES